MQRYSLILLIAIVIATTGFMPAGIANKYSSSLIHNEMPGDTIKKWDLVVTRVFNAPVASVWKAWSDAESVMKWWGPTGFTSPVCKMDFREGGSTLVCMRAPKEFGGMDMYNTWSWKKIIPMEYIDYIFGWADKDGNKIDPTRLGLPPDMPRDMRHTVTFKDLGNGKTEMTITEYGYVSDQQYDLSKGGLEQCLDKMAAMF
jgi:uncharacterized protein YndB with AHSA1/START domain